MYTTAHIQLKYTFVFIKSQSKDGGMYMEKNLVEEILKERVETNNRIFTAEESNNIFKNITLYSKVYLLGILDTKM